MDNQKEQPSYYAIIPANVRYDDRLSGNEKLIYGEITCLTKKTNECWASNDYFAKLYKVDKITISRWISKLKRFGYLTVRLEYKQGKEISGRFISLCIEGINKNVDTPYIQNNQEGIDEIVNTPIGKNVKDNNTSNINNTSNNSVVVELIDLFKEVNLSYKKFFAIKAERIACKELLESFTLEEIKQRMLIVPKYNKMPYIGNYNKIYSPTQLLRNWKVMEDNANAFINTKKEIKEIIM